jgi:hypothetical protein
LLPPGVVQSAGVDRVEAEILDQVEHCGLGGWVVTADWNGDPVGVAGGAPPG